MVALLLALSVPHAAYAEDGPVTSSFTEEFKVRYWRQSQRLPGFPDNPVFDYGEQVNRLTGTVQTGKHAFSFQLDEVDLFATRYYLDDVRYEERQLVSPDVWNPWPTDFYATPEKLRYTYTSKLVSMDLGDTYAAFARGIAVNLNRNVDIDIDTSIQGVKTAWRKGDWEATGLAGTLNRQQVFLENQNIAIKPDVHHGVAGVDVERYGLGKVDVGAHAVGYDFVDVPGWNGVKQLGSPDALVYGGTAQLNSVLGLDTYLEGDGLAYPSTSGDPAHPSSVLFGGAAPSPGYALYGSSAAYVGKTTWLLEGKRYLNAERLNAVVGPELYKVSVPPTLEYERVITEDSQAAVSSNNVYGGRLKVDYTQTAGKDGLGNVTPYASMAVFRDLDTEGLHFNHVPETIFHPLVGVEALLPEWSLILDAGYRVDDRDGEKYGADRMAHADVDLKVPLFGPFEGDVAVAGKAYHWGKNDFQQTDYVEIESATTLQKGSDVALIGYLDYTTNPLVTSKGNFSDSTYGAVELQVKPTSAITVKAFYGAYKAGIRCSGGQCRLLPGFDGARLTFSGNF